MLDVKPEAKVEAKKAEEDESEIITANISIHNQKLESKAMGVIIDIEK